MAHVVSGLVSHSKPPRDLRLDFWRGLCLIDMIVVHLIYAGIQLGGFLTPLFGEYTRFAAGGFVFIAGFGIGMIFLPRVLSTGAERWKTYQFLWKRSAFILGIHYAAAASFIVMDAIQGKRNIPHESWPLLWDLISLQEGGDLLPFYAMIFALTPLVLEVIRRGWWPLVLVTSMILFFVGQHSPWFLSPYKQGTFPLILWQSVFIAGLFFAILFPHYQKLPVEHRKVPVLLCWIGFAFLFLSEYSHLFGFTSPFLPFTFRKLPLSDGELLRYLILTVAIMLTTDLYWSRISRFQFVSDIAVIGRQSLLIYLAHIYLQEIVMAGSPHYQWMGPAQILVIILTIIFLWKLACLIEKREAKLKETNHVLHQWAKGWGAPSVGLATAALILITANYLLAEFDAKPLLDPPPSITLKIADSAVALQTSSTLPQELTETSTADDDLQSPEETQEIIPSIPIADPQNSEVETVEL